MEVRSDLGIVAGREQYSVGLQKSPLQPQTMQLSFTPDGAPIYKPVAGGSTIYQATGAGAGEGVGDIGEGAAQAVAPYRVNMNVGEPIKRKRGRPRKYGPEGAMALELGSLSSPMGASGSSGFPSSASASSNPASSPSSASASVTKKARGRPPGSGKKQQLAALGILESQFPPPSSHATVFFWIRRLW